MTTEPLASPASAGVPKVPYRGIEEFRYIDSPIYFGRDFEARRLLRLVTIYRGVLLYGDSGVGKSSLVNAKAMPLAVDDGYAPERVRVQPVKGAEFVVERIAPSDEPGVYLPSLFDDGTVNRRIGLPADTFFARLDQSCRTTDCAVYPLMILDQFEELETLTEEALRRGDASAQEAHDAIVATLLRILRDETLRVKLLFVFREDYYAKLTGFFVQSPTLVDNYLRLEPMHSSQLDEIINGPFRKVTFDHELPSDVAELLKRELSARGDLLTLSEVQIACLSLWRAAEPMKLLQAQHVSGLLEMYFSKAIEALDFELRNPATALLDELVTESGTRNVISADTLADALQEDHHIPNDVTRRALEALDKTAHVIRRERRNDVEVYEIVSEFLVPWIMRRKVEMQANKAFEQRLLRAAKMARWAVAAVGVVALLGVGAWIFQEMTRTKSFLERRVATLTEELRAAQLSIDTAARAKEKAEGDAKAARAAAAAADAQRVSEAALAAAELNRRLESERAAANAAAKTAMEKLQTQLDDAQKSSRDLKEKAGELQRATDKVREVEAERDALKARLDKLPKSNVQPWQEWLRTSLGFQVAERAPETVKKYKLPAGVVVTEVVRGSRVATWATEGVLIVGWKVDDTTVKPEKPYPVTKLEDIRSALASAKKDSYLHFVWIAPGSIEQHSVHIKMNDLPTKF